MKNIFKLTILFTALQSLVFTVTYANKEKSFNDFSNGKNKRELIEFLYKKTQNLEQRILLLEKSNTNKEHNDSK
jgi:hypothetical protein